jgi:translation initiation factor IF-3
VRVIGSDGEMIGVLSRDEALQMAEEEGLDLGDYQIKLRKMREFLDEGDKVKVNIRFRGREMSHQELGREMAARIEADLGEDIVIESRPRLEGRQMVMMIAPKKK